MGWTWKPKKARPRTKKRGPFVITREDRAFMPDRILRITIPNPNPLKRSRIQIYVAPPRCPRCETLMVNERCPRAPGRRKWCDG